MAKNRNGKLRMFYLLRYLQQHTDENHGVSMAQILQYLSENDIPCERKTIYDDVQLLRDALGYDIDISNRPHADYRLLSRELEDPELRLLVDAVCASRFITQKKSASLIKKLQTLTSEWGRRELTRQVYVDNRIKSMNESIYVNVDALHRAINSRSQAQFKYFDYDTAKNRVLRHGGKVYSVNPLALLFSNENYYLVAYNDERGGINNYRVDRMLEVHATDMPFSAAASAPFDINEYSERQFSMFPGEREKVRLEFENSLVNAVIDRFGQDITLVPAQNGRFSVNPTVELSPTFFGWLFQFADRAAVTAPQHAVELYKKQLNAVLESCSGK